MLYADYSGVPVENWRGVLDAAFAVTDFHGECLVDQYVAIPVEWISEAYPRNEIFRVEDGSGVELGWLLSTKGYEYSYSVASKQFVAAFLRDARFDEVFDGYGALQMEAYRFKSHYFVVSAINYARYNTSFRKGSGVWGGFLHIEECPPMGALGAWSGVIRASSDVALPGNQHLDALRFGLRASSSLDRFLHFYHLLEIGFDLSVVDELRALGPDLRGVGKLISKISQKELERLIYLLRKKCGSGARFYEDRLREVFSDSAYHDRLMEMLFDYDKEGNPFKDQRAKFLRAAASGFSATSIASEKLNWSDDNVSKMLGYVVYRFRCCIAHTRIGEHILGADDEEFVFKIGEPLIRSILLELYRI